MKILLINNFYYNRGGDCTYLFSLQNLLKERNNKVIIFSMHHPLNFDSEYSKYFVSYINYDEEIRSKSISSGLKVAKRTIYSSEARDRIEKLIEIEKPDVAHIQNIHHHITPSIFKALKDRGIPIVWTLHDYTLICPNTSFLSNGKVCEKCKKKKYFWPSIVRCKKNSFAASTMAAIEISVHLLMKYYDQVDYFIAPSEFIQKKLIEYGMKKEKIVHINNFTCFQDEEIKKVDNENYFIYLGRLSVEKGIKTLIDASVEVFSTEESLKKVKLKIIGDGPLGDEMRSYVKSKGAEGNIEFLGHKTHDEAMEILKKSRFLVIPSEWYENFPYSVLEAFAMAKPVIASRMGGIPELVRNWKTGLLFETQNFEALAQKIKFMLNHPEKAEVFGENAKKLLTEEINLENHYKKLIETYKKAIGHSVSK